MNRKVKQNYEELAQVLSLRLDTEGCALYGKRGAYDVIIYPQNANYPYMLTVALSVQRPAGALTKEACKQFKQNNDAVSALTQNGLSVTMTLKGCNKQSTLQENTQSALNALVNMLRAEGFQNCCQTCGSDNPSTCYVSGSYMHLCPTCLGRMQQDSSMVHSKNLAKKENVLAGIVGALLGSLLGVASIIILSRLGYVAAISGIIMAVCTLKGYEMLGGKLSTKGIVISIVLMILMTAVGDRMDWAFVVTAEVDIDVLSAFSIIPDLLKSGIIDTSAYIGNLIIQYLFVLLGAVPTIVSAVKSRKIQGHIYCLGNPAQSAPREDM